MTNSQNFNPQIIVVKADRKRKMALGRPCCGGSCIGGNCKILPENVLDVFKKN